MADPANVGGRGNAVVKVAAVSGATSGNNTLVAAVTGKAIRIRWVYLIAITAVTVKFQDGAGGTDLSGAMSLPATGGFVLNDNPSGWGQTTAGTLLNMVLGGAVQVSGSIGYEEI